MKTKPKNGNPLIQFEKFKEFAQKIVKVPKKEIEEQQKKYEARKKKAKS